MDWMLVPVRRTLPSGLDALRAEARTEGFRALERLAAEWQDGSQRFAGPGGALLAAIADARLIGIGGVTLDPDYPEAMRMRRFYVARAWRRRGVARAIASTLLAAQPAGRLVTVHAGTAEAAAFWEALGFATGGARPGHSHALIVGEPPAAGR
jgi:GNAT superfamily N-acetyltransferase